MGQQHSAPSPPKPWRKPTKEFSEENMKAYVSKMQGFLPPRNASFANIMMVGMVGHGKSSFINTIVSAFTGKISNAANAMDIKGSATKKMRYHEIETANFKTKFRLVDTMGIENEKRRDGNGDDDDNDKDDIKNIMKGHIKNQYKFKKGSPISPDDPYYNKCPQIEDRMHAVVIVLDGQSFPELFPQAKINLTQVIDTARNLDLPVMLLITKIDLVDDSDVTKVFRNKKFKEKVDLASNIYGVRTSDVWPVKNFSGETQVEWQTCHLALQAVEAMLNRAEETIRMMSEEGYAP